MTVLVQSCPALCLYNSPQGFHQILVLSLLCLDTYKSSKWLTDHCPGRRVTLSIAPDVLLKPVRAHVHFSLGPELLARHLAPSSLRVHLWLTKSQARVHTTTGPDGPGWSPQERTVSSALCHPEEHRDARSNGSRLLLEVWQGRQGSKLYWASTVSWALPMSSSWFSCEPALRFNILLLKKQSWWDLGTICVT